METASAKEWFLRKHEAAFRSTAEARYRDLEKKYQELAQTARSLLL